MKLLNSRLLQKYFLSYLGVLLIPLMLIGFLVFNYFSVYLEEDIIQNNQEMLKQVQAIVDNEMQGMRNIAYQIAADDNMIPYKVKNNGYGGMRAVNSLKSYIISNSFIEELYLYFRDDELLYSPVSTYTPARLLDTKYTYQHWGLEEFVDTINHAESPILRPAEEVILNGATVQTEKLLTYIVPIPVYEPSPYATVIFQVKESKLKELMRGIQDNYSGNTVILDEKGDILTTLYEEEYMHASDQQEILQPARAGMGSDKVTWNDNEYLRSYITSGTSHWSYITIIPTSEVMKEITHFKYIALTLFLIVLLVGSGLVYYLSIQQYNPIKHLMKTAEEKFGMAYYTRNEFEFIQLVVDHLSDKNQVLSEQVQSSKSALRDMLLFKLMKGQILDIKEFNAAGREIQLTFSKRYFSVAVFWLDHDNEGQKDSLITYLERKMQSEELEGYVKETFDNHSVLVIVASDHQRVDYVQDYIGMIKKEIYAAWQLPVTVGIGNPYEESYLIGKSYMEAMTAINYRLIWGNNKIICFNDISENIYDINDYPKHNFEQFELALKREDTEAVIDSMGKITQYIKHHNISILMARSICYDVINTIIRTMVSMKANHFIDKDKYPDVVSLLKFETVEQLEDEVNRICQDLLRAIERNKMDASMDIKSKILAYIQDNYCNPNFSVQNMSEEIGVSSSYISRYFKEHTGQSVTDYVNVHRIELAKELLQASNDSLQVVVHKVGYYDVSSFIRKFKGMTGITPGEYRKQHK
ncbi:helix-turn-helix domain-containing protein [Paenibacillus thiaminolyticus]|uniref:AraC family transcriptional regulator n=1 Tax=Paenibacillus thiaminolyticus TaxID=49283 RepID=A0A3A3H233_PANTH|nr:helix-turn-helix domain-containing protein [Paenibacillus thiaminolyticus]RJG25276.1 AraC family transcriptional regulator [Paenibacillus thiaminolyticus]